MWRGETPLGIDRSGGAEIAVQSVYISGRVCVGVVGLFEGGNPTR